MLPCHCDHLQFRLIERDPFEANWVTIEARCQGEPHWLNWKAWLNLPLCSQLCYTRNSWTFRCIISSKHAALDQHHLLFGLSLSDIKSFNERLTGINTKKKIAKRSIITRVRNSNQTSVLVYHNLFCCFEMKWNKFYYNLYYKF